MPSLSVSISEHDLDDRLIPVIRKTMTELGKVAKIRAQQIIGEELNDDSGDLKAGIGFEINKTAGGVELVLFSEGADPYALYQHDGTGIYGPKKTPIKPKRGKFLVWMGDDGKLIFAKSVKGVPAKKFLTRGMEFAMKRILR